MLPLAAEPASPAERPEGGGLGQPGVVLFGEGEALFAVRVGRLVVAGRRGGHREVAQGHPDAGVVAQGGVPLAGLLQQRDRAVALVVVAEDGQEPFEVDAAHQGRCVVEEFGEGTAFGEELGGAGEVAVPEREPAGRPEPGGACGVWLWVHGHGAVEVVACLGEAAECGCPPHHQAR